MLMHEKLVRIDVKIIEMREAAVKMLTVQALQK